MKSLQLFFFTFLWIGGCFAQRVQHPYHTGLSAYYYWEEQNDTILPGSFKPLQLLSIETSIVTPQAADLLCFQAGLSKCEEKSKHDSSISGKINRPLSIHWNEATKRQSILVCSNKGKLTVKKTGPILYFDIDYQGKFHFRSGGDSIQLTKNQVNVRPSSGHFYVFTYLSKDQTVYNERVLAFSGDDVTQSLLEKDKAQPEKLVVFINGYRGPTKEHEMTTNMVNRNDPTGYWFKLDDRYIKRLQTDAAFYLDAHFSVKTSNHRSRIRFGWSWFKSRLFKHSHPKKHPHVFNVKSNIEGFNYRYDQGKIGGEAFLTARCSGINCQETKDTLYVVSHSMGYAYMLGFLDVVKEHVVLQNAYLLAPENATVAAFDWGQFQEVWQYGTNLDQDTATAIAYQDGVAPQQAVKQLNQVHPDKGGRVFFPENWPNQNFINSHMIYSYDWIFDRIRPGQPGYVHP